MRGRRCCCPSSPSSPSLAPLARRTPTSTGPPAICSQTSSAAAPASSSRRSISRREQSPQRVEARLGYTLPRDSYTIFIATTGEHVDGYAVIDDELGEHLPITFAVKLSPTGVVERQEIVAYREPRGDEVRDERFRRQFQGKSVRDGVRAGEDIVTIGGATISSRSMAVGVKRVLVLVDEALLRPLQISAASTRR